jgi:uncharacterized membrane protein YhhN
MKKLLTEYWFFLRSCVAWWLVPYVLIVAAIAVLAWRHDQLPSFIYPIF